MLHLFFTFEPNSYIVYKPWSAMLQRKRTFVAKSLYQFHPVMKKTVRHFLYRIISFFAHVPFCIYLWHMWIIHLRYTDPPYPLEDTAEFVFVVNIRISTEWLLPQITLGSIIFSIHCDFSWSNVSDFLEITSFLFSFHFQVVETTINQSCNDSK